MRKSWAAKLLVLTIVIPSAAMATPAAPAWEHANYLPGGFLDDERWFCGVGNWQGNWYHGGFRRFDCPNEPVS